MERVELKGLGKQAILKLAGKVVGLSDSTLVGSTTPISPLRFINCRQPPIDVIIPPLPSSCMSSEALRC